MFGMFEILILFVPLVIILPLVALINLLKNEFKGNDKLIWLLVILFLPVIGSILYFSMGKNSKIDPNANLR